MWAALDVGYWLSLLLALPAVGFLVRLFMIQHDCGHGAFFRHRVANDWIGRAIGALTLTPYDFWRRTHAIHHATSGNLEHRGIGDVDILIVNDYLARRMRDRTWCNPRGRSAFTSVARWFNDHALALARGGCSHCRADAMLARLWAQQRPRTRCCRRSTARLVRPSPIMLRANPEN